MIEKGTQKMSNRLVELEKSSLSIIATRYKFNTRTPIIKIADRICSDRRFSGFLSVCCTSSVTKQEFDIHLYESTISTSKKSSCDGVFTREG
jgi:predicted DNA-binding ribbon-helix-helix protein